MRTEEFKHIILPMRSDLKAYALRLTESDDMRSLDCNIAATSL